MKTKFKDNRGLTLLVVMMAISLLSVLLAGVISYSLNSYKNSRRLALVVESQMAAVSELEFLYNRWVQRISTISTSTDYEALPAVLKEDGVVNQGDTNMELTPKSSIGRTDDYGTFRVNRSLTFAEGVSAGFSENQKYEARINLTYRHPSFGEITATAARKFSMIKKPIFTQAIFVQGDMELSPGGHMKVNGPVTVNGNIYAGAKKPYYLTFFDVVTVNGKFNGTTDKIQIPWQIRNPNLGSDSSDLNTAQFDPVDESILRDASGNRVPYRRPRSWDDSRQKQLNIISAPVNFMGGAEYDSEAFPVENDFYRSIIAPPPLDAEGMPIEEDSVIKANRMYTKASLIIKIDQGNALKIFEPSQPEVNYADNPHFRNVVVSSIRQNIVDPRQGAVNLSTLNIAALKTAMEATNLDDRFQGVVYIYDTQQGIDKPAGILVKEGVNTPDFNGKGFTLASDNALYVQGNYNTRSNNRAVLMGDAVMAVSPRWNPQQSNSPIDNRNAAASNDPGDRETQTIVAAVIAGGTETKRNETTNLYESGGGIHNLVRFVEDWQNRNFKLKGSIGQLFYSKHYTAKFRDPIGSPGVYKQPANRIFEFDSTLAVNPPGGSVAITHYSRGPILN